jgi:hypothetical protein
MIIKLFQPPTHNWLIIAEQLDDPPTWDRFVPCHSAESQRWKFDSAVKDAAGNGLTVKPHKNMLARGVSAFEYDWNAGDDDVLQHAIQVADTLGLELSVDS